MKFFFLPSPNPMKVALLLEELQTPYELIGVDTFKGEQHLMFGDAAKPFSPRMYGA